MGLIDKNIKELNYSEYVGLVCETNRPSGGIRTVQKVCTNAFINNKTKVLEIGCNTGFTSINITQLTGASVLGIDLTEESLKAANKKIKKYGIENIIFEKASATSLPYKDESFDVVWLSNVLSFIDEKELALKECIRVLKKGGFLAFVPIYYQATPPQNIVDKVSEAINSKLDIFKKDDWIDFVKKMPSKMEMVFNEDFEYLDVSNNVDNYLAEVFGKESLSNIEPEKIGALKKRGEYFMKLFNENLKYAAFSIFILQKRNYIEEKELFLSKSIMENK